MKIALFGASGLLGCAVRSELQGLDVVAPTHREGLDLTNPEAVMQFFRSRVPDIVINCAGLSNVESCEQFPRDAWALNSEAVGHIASGSADVGARLVHMSTDYVFGGRRSGNYVESDSPSPLQVYGTTKLDGESRALSADNSLVVRLPLLFGGAAPESHWAIRAYRALSASADQWLDDSIIRQPTSASDAARAIVRLAVTDIGGVVHVAPPTEATRFEWAQSLAAVLGVSDAWIHRLNSSGSGTIERPERSRLATIRLPADWPWHPRPLNEALETFATELLSRQG
jgi:dTDP-4-dehydrorhamnose reductase